MVTYSILLLAVIGLLTWLTTLGGAYPALALVGLFGLLVAYQVVQHYRDLREPLAESEGIVSRAWARADLIIVWHSYYVSVAGSVYRLPPEEYVLLEDRWRALNRLDPPRPLYVKVVHFPHTKTAVSVHEMLPPPPATAPDA
jgi:xanthosine utilization system XapX-like protein